MISPDAEIDLHSCRPHEVRVQLLSFLDSGLVRDWEKVHIIHGKGTGTLKSFVWEMLEDLPYVDDFELGSVYEGGRGLTVVYYDDTRSGRSQNG